MGNCCTGSPTTDHPFTPDHSLPPPHSAFGSSSPQLGGASSIAVATGPRQQSSAAPYSAAGAAGLGGGGEDATDSVVVVRSPDTVVHMADREDLTNQVGTMFLHKAKEARKMMANGAGGNTRSGSERQRHSSARLSHPSRGSSPVTIQKANSCSTIYTDDSTVSLPNLKYTLKCVSLAVFYHIKNRDRTRPPRTLLIFDEKEHPLTREEVPPHYADYTPDHKIIYKFIKTLFHAAQLTAECAIITLIYLERVLHYADLDLHPSNWKRILLGAILLASKVWDDQAVWNVDYCQILRDISVEDMNELERVYLEQLQFNINVASSTYAQYYFDLRSLAEDNGLSFPNEYEALTKERATQLEALSETYDFDHKHNLKKSASSEPIASRQVAVLM